MFALPLPLPLLLPSAVRWYVCLGRSDMVRLDSDRSYRATQREGEGERAGDGRVGSKTRLA